MPWSEKRVGTEYTEQVVLITTTELPKRLRTINDCDLIVISLVFLCSTNNWKMLFPYFPRLADMYVVQQAQTTRKL